MSQMQIELPNETFLNEQKLPLAVEATPGANRPEDLYGLLKEAQLVLRQKLLTYGGLLFRGFGLQTPQQFSEAIDVLGLGQSLDYIGGDSPRDKVWGHVYTSTEAPPGVMIPLHNELSFVKHYPKHIYFCCEVAPEQGGETIIGDARAIYQTVDPEVRQKMEGKGIRYVSRYFHKSRVMDWLNRMQRSHKSWTEVFEATTKEEVEEKCRVNDFGFKWHKSDWLEVWQDRPASIEHPQTRERVWFNQVHLYDFNPRLLGTWRWAGAKLFYSRSHTRLHDVSYADGTSINRADLYHVMDVLDSQTIRFPWQQGDLLVLDNVLAMHGRATFSPPRRILTAMTG